MKETSDETLLGDFATRLIGVVFALLLIAPFIAWLTGVELVKPVEEFRVLAERPTPQQFADKPAKAVNQLRSYYNDHFGLRHLFLRTNAVINVELLQQSSSDSVILGRDQWLFYRSPVAPYHWEPADYYNDHPPLSAERLQARQDRLVARQKWLAARNIRYYLVIAPAKPGVYPEFFPHEIDPTERTPLDTFISHIGETTDVEIIDLRPVMMSAKNGESPIYLQWDSHWNDLGAHAAYTEIMQRLKGQFPAAKSLPIGNFERVNVTKGSYDLSRIAAIDGWFSNTEPTLNPPPLPRATGRDATWPGATEADRDITCPDAALGGAVVFHDSFGLALRPFLARSFQHVGFAHQLNFDARIVEHISPDVVIQVIVERQIMSDAIPNDIWEEP